MFCVISAAMRWAILGFASALKSARGRRRPCALPEAQGKGYASEALQAICDYGFSTLGVRAINAWVLAENRGSSRLLEKQGFVRTQVLEKAYHLNGVDYDDWIYRLERGSHPAPADAG